MGDEVRRATGGLRARPVSQRAAMGNAWRFLRRRPGFALAVVLTLAIGIGANTAVFGLIHAVLLSPLPYEEPDALYAPFEQHTSGRSRPPSYPTFRDWAERADVFAGLAFARGAPLTYRAEGRAGLLVGAFVTEGFFDVLGVPAEIGRVLDANDHRAGSPGAVVLSHRAWARWFGSELDILGTVLTFGEESFSVVGVMPPSFAFPDWGADNDPWLPSSHAPPAERAALEQRGFTADSRIVVRIPNDLSVEVAERRLSDLAETLAAAHPDVSGGWTSVLLQPLAELEVRGVRSRLYLLWGAVLLVLLMCCANLASLYLVQGTSRRREYAVRAALGASRGRIFQQVMTETLLLASIGGAGGVILAHRSMAWARSALADLPRIAEVSVDGAVLAFAAALCLLTAVAFALLATRRAEGLDRSLRAAGRGSTDTSSLLSAIQAGQVGVTFVLVMGAWLFGETLLNLVRVDPGYDPENVLVVPVQPPSPAYDQETAAVTLYQALVDAIAAVPGVTSIAVTNHGPGGLAGLPMPAALDRAPAEGEQDLTVTYRTVSAGYFETLGTRVIAGREFTEDDLLGEEGPVIINETLAARFGGTAAAVGGRIGVRKAASTRADFGEVLLGNVVGVVEDLDLSETGGQPEPFVYVPFTHTPWAQARILARTNDLTAGLMQAVEEAVRSVEPAIPLSGAFTSVRPLEEQRSAARAQQRLSAGLVGAFAAVALMLACIGMFGVVSFVVTSRTREIGVRMALGAAPRRAASDVVRQAMLIGGHGLAVGALAAVLLSSLVTSLLYDVMPLDSRRYGAVAALLVALAGAAAYIPARRASRLDPASVLRSD